MHPLAEPAYPAVLRAHDRPKLDSYDCGEEFSLYHWLDVCELMDDRDGSLNDELLSDEEPKPALTETASEVEPTAAY